MDLQREYDRHLRLMESVVKHATFGVVISEIRDDGARIVYVNDAFTLASGYALADVEGKSPLVLSDPANVETDRARFAAAMRNRSQEPLEVLNFRKDGTPMWVDVSIFTLHDERGAPTHAIAFQRDVGERRAAEAAALRAKSAEDTNATLAHEIAERKRAEQRLLHAASHDSLTGLPNRVLFVERVRRALARGKRRPDYRVAVLFLDCDRFKLVNDTLGHFTGDLLLVALARRLENRLRPGDVLARFGGDEFTILLDDAGSEAAAIAVGQRCLEALAKPFALGGHEVYASASIGIALANDRDASPEDLLRDADIAMYRAKERGKNRCELFAPEMQRIASRRHRLEVELRRAIERAEIAVAYQPIVSLADRRLCGFEALLRWRHCDLGEVVPSEFIAVAEETGLILPLGDWILRRACEQLLCWQKSFPALESLSVSVNVAARQLLEQPFAERVRGVLADTGLRPDLLHLEITESSLMNDPEAATRVLCDLRELNVKVHMDDFGTGYSSLAYLHRFPIDTLKIDRSFVSDGESGEIANLEIVRTVIALARHLRLEVTAEGVETEAQEAQLRLLECDHAQGFLYARPLAPADASGYIAAAARDPHGARRRPVLQKAAG